MNAPVIDRAFLARAIADIEERFPLTIAGLLPDGVVGHPAGSEPLILLAEGKQGLSLLDVCSAEVALEDRLGAPTRIVLRSELRDDRGAAIAAQARLW